MYNIEEIQEIMKKHGFTIEDDEQYKWNLGAGLSIQFVVDHDEPGIVLSHRGRYYYSRKFTVEEIISLIEVCTWFGILSERLVEIYDGCTANCEVVSSITLSEYNGLKEQASIAKDYDELKDSYEIAYNELKDSYEIAKENLERSTDDCTVLVQRIGQLNKDYLKMKRDYDIYQRILTCILSQFEARESDW